MPGPSVLIMVMKILLTYKMFNNARTPIRAHAKHMKHILPHLAPHEPSHENTKAKHGCMMNTPHKNDVCCTISPDNIKHLTTQHHFATPTQPI
jgi:hypothetical protein